jgi:ribosomal protein S18 acetylase RimI-like enzyme
MTTLNFRLATVDDAPLLQQLIQGAFQAEDSRVDWTADMALGRSFTYDVEEVLSTINRTEDAAVIMATDEGGRLVGSVQILIKQNNDNATVARFAFLSVDPTQQQGGIGRRVLAYAEDYAQRQWNVELFGLGALSSREKLIEWYIRCGYAKTGETSPFPVEQFKELDLDKGLCFVELEKRVASGSVSGNE